MTTSQYPLTRLFLIPENEAPTSSVLSFQSARAVENYFGASSFEAKLAKEFFAGASGATMLFSRYCLEGARPRLFGANLSPLTLGQLRKIGGSLSLTFQDWTYSASVNLSGASSFSAAATEIQKALNKHLQVAAVTTNDSITPVSVSFTGSIKGILLTVKSVTSGSMELGARISGPGIPAGAEIVTQCDGTPGGAGVYALYAPIQGTVSTKSMKESYGVLTVGSVTDGIVADGELVKGAGVPASTGIEDNLSGTGAGSTWVVNNAPTHTVKGGLTMTATPLNVQYHYIVGAPTNHGYFSIQPAGAFGFDENPGALSYVGGTAATALGLSQMSGALNSPSSGFPTSAAAYMNSLIQNENGQFSSFQVTGDPLVKLDPAYQGDLAAWAQSTGGLNTFLHQTNSTPPAGSNATSQSFDAYSLLSSSGGVSSSLAVHTVTTAMPFIAVGHGPG